MPQVNQGTTINTRQQATAQLQNNVVEGQDWRVMLKLAPGANYLYRATNPGILQPIKQTDGLIFPYTPAINVIYSANYDPQDITHSNYKIFQYRSSSVDSIGITCDFTAQDVNEANYILATIHFLRSLTKMFYGKDENPRNGTPPPLCYLYGMGEFQFNKHPLAITNFSYNLPTDVDYIPSNLTSNSADSAYTSDISSSISNSRIISSGLSPGALPLPTDFTDSSGSLNDRYFNDTSVTYVPTRIQLQINAVPIVSRLDISKNFSLRDYATGSLLQGNIRNGGGIW